MPETHQHIAILEGMRDRKKTSIQEGRPTEQYVDMIQKHIAALDRAIHDMKELNVLSGIIKKLS